MIFLIEFIACFSLICIFIFLLVFFCINMFSFKTRYKITEHKNGTYNVQYFSFGDTPTTIAGILHSEESCINEIIKHKNKQKEKKKIKKKTISLKEVENLEALKEII